MLDAFGRACMRLVELVAALVDRQRLPERLHLAPVLAGSWASLPGIVSDHHQLPELLCLPPWCLKLKRGDGKLPRRGYFRRSLARAGFIFILQASALKTAALAGCQSCRRLH